MSCHFIDLFLIIIVHFIDRLCFFIFGTRKQFSFFKSQFTAIQFAVIGSYLPSLMLSGYLFDLRSVPWFISAVGRLMPPTYAIESVKILYLSGEPERIVQANLALLAAAALGFFALALVFARKRLD